MKKSIRFKITGLLTISVLCIIALCWLLNMCFIEQYYEKNKLSTISDTFYKTLDLCKKSQGDLSYEDIAEIDKLNVNRNVSIFVVAISAEGEDIYPNFGTSKLADNMEAANKLLASIYSGYDVAMNYTELQSTEMYHIVRYYNKRVDSDYIHLISKVTDYTEENEVTYIISICTTYQSMHESVLIANKFLAYVGIIVTIVGSFAMFLLSKRFSKPIQELSQIAESMSQLNFNIKYMGNSKDEIGALGNSMNLLSEKLQSNISELKSANNELKNDIEKKDKQEEMRREFLSNVSHELKTPIALIQGYAEGLIENVNDDEESRNFYCEVIADEASKMNKIVQKLMTLNQIEFGTENISFERFDLTELVKSIISSSEILAQQKGATFIYEETEPVYVWSDETIVEEVLNNYISNAIHYVDGERLIEVKLIRHDNVVRVAVFNTGDNIPEEEIDKIWMKFYKVDKARSREYGGSGVGLSIVKAIMESINQKYGVINRLAGVEFWFELDVK